MQSNNNIFSCATLYTHFAWFLDGEVLKKNQESQTDYIIQTS